MDILIKSAKAGIAESINLSELRKSDPNFGDVLDYLKEKKHNVKELSCKEDLIFQYVDSDRKLIPLRNDERVKDYSVSTSVPTFFLVINENRRTSGIRPIRGTSRINVPLPGGPPEPPPRRRNKFIAAGVGILVLIFIIVSIIVSNVELKNDKHAQPTVSKVETSDKQIRKKPKETPVVLENPLQHMTDLQAQQFKLTDALRKRPRIIIEAQGMKEEASAKMSFANNGEIIVWRYEDSFTSSLNNRYFGESRKNQSLLKPNMKLLFSWSPSESAYIGTWSNSHWIYNNSGSELIEENVRKRITLWPQYDSHGNIKCFSGYTENGSGSHDTIIKIKNLLCLCPDPG